MPPDTEEAALQEALLLDAIAQAGRVVCLRSQPKTFRQRTRCVEIDVCVNHSIGSNPPYKGQEQ